MLNKKNSYQKKHVMFLVKTIIKFLLSPVKTALVVVTIAGQTSKKQFLDTNKSQTKID